MGFNVNSLIWFADKHASDRKVLLFLVLQLAMGALLTGAALHFGTLAHGVLPLDVTFFYGTEAATRFFTELPPEAAQFYLRVLSPLDLVFPLLYAFSFALIVVWLLKKLALRGCLYPQWLVLYPFVPALFDYLENIGIVSLLHLSPVSPQALMLATSLCSSAKWFAAFNGLGIMLYLLFKLRTMPPKRAGRPY